MSIAGTLNSHAIQSNQFPLRMLVRLVYVWLFVSVSVSFSLSLSVSLSFSLCLSIFLSLSLSLSLVHGVDDWPNTKMKPKIMIQSGFHRDSILFFCSVGAATGSHHRDAQQARGGDAQAAGGAGVGANTAR